MMRNNIVEESKIIDFQIKVFEMVNANMGVESVNCSTLRFLWSVIEQTQTHTLVELNDTDLVKQLLKQLEANKALSTEETSTIRTYLDARTTLIRDLAEARLA